MKLLSINIWSTKYLKTLNPYGLLYPIGEGIQNILLQKCLNPLLFTHQIGERFVQYTMYLVLGLLVIPPWFSYDLILITSIKIKDTSAFDWSKIRLIPVSIVLAGVFFFFSSNFVILIVREFPKWTLLSFQS